MITRRRIELDKHEKELRGPKSKKDKEAIRFGKFRIKDSGEHGQEEGLPILRQKQQTKSIPLVAKARARDTSRTTSTISQSLSVRGSNQQKRYHGMEI